MNFCAAREHIIKLICPVSISSELKAEPDIKLSSQIFTLSFKLHTPPCTLCLTLYAFFAYMHNGEGCSNTVTKSWLNLVLSAYTSICRVSSDLIHTCKSMYLTALTHINGLNNTCRHWTSTTWHQYVLRCDIRKDPHYDLKVSKHVWCRAESKTNSELYWTINATHLTLLCQN
jgi:hypothetical protein